MKLGIDSYATRNSGLDPAGVLGVAAELGLAGVLFELSPFQSFRDDDLARIHAAAEEKRLYLEFGMGSILHWHPMAEKGRQLLADAGYDMRVSDAKTRLSHCPWLGFIKNVGNRKPQHTNFMARAAMASTGHNRPMPS